MPRVVLWKSSLTRAELDQRSREARLRLEQAERLWVARLLARERFLRRVLRALRLLINVDAQVKGRSVKARASGGQRRQRCETPSDTGGITAGSCAVPPVSWPRCPRPDRVGSSRSGPAIPTRGQNLDSGRRNWDHSCG
jgi:hypothetical protein